MHDEFSLNFYDYGARWFDPGMASWWEVDPASEGNRRWSPFAYGNNNPVRFIDPDGRESSAFGGFTSSDEIAARHAAETDARDDKKNWVQQFLDYLGVFVQPESEEEAAEYAARQERFANAADHLAKGGEGLKSKAEYVPIVGGIVNISQGAVKKDNTQIVVGIASIMLDAVPGGKGAKSGAQFWTSTTKLSSVQNAFTHWKKHALEFPEYINTKQYVEGAKNLLNTSPSGTLVKTRPNGDVLKYHPNTNTFGVRNDSGTHRTMFRPSDGMKYWLKQ